MALSAEQKAFLEHPPTQSARLLAGPGTGKSFTSVAYLEKVAEQSPHIRVGYITFTRAATAEFAKKMDDSGLSALGGQPPKTMHGYSLGILIRHRSSRIPYPLRIPDDWELSQIIRPDISRRLRAKGYEQATPTIVTRLEAELAASFQSLSGDPLPIAEEQPDLTSAYVGVWHDHRQRYGYTLLSELPYQAGGVLEDLDESDLGIDLLIVDEYQDLNRADQKVLKELHRRGVAILAIGDDDQSIYSWRNAAPEGIRKFTTEFNTPNDYPLTVSQRCGGRALEVANQLIEQDPDRPRKDRLQPAHRAPNTEFRYLRFRTNVQEAFGVARLVQARLKSGIEPSDIAVLVRSSLQSWTRELEPAFSSIGVPLAPPADVRSLLADRGIRAALSLGQLIRNRHDALAWRGLIEVTRGLGDAVVNYIDGSEGTGNFAQKLIALRAQGFNGLRATRPLQNLVDNVLEVVSSAPDPNSAPRDTGWAVWLADRAGMENFDPIALTQFLAVGDFVGNTSALSGLINEFQSLLKELTSTGIDGVQLMTMGMSKGLTVNTAIVMGAEAGNIPSPRGDEAEELRLLYVALTRATNMTVITYANRRTGPTARIGRSHVGAQRERSTFMSNLRGVEIEDGEAFL
jgi:DNA helicase-2/ATP-dependent DNA helicase PcrA